MVVAAAAGALALHRQGASPDVADWTGVQMNGTTSQRLPLYAVERKGAIRAIYMNWRVRCSSGRTSVVGAQFREPLFPIRHDGLRFSAVTRAAPAGALAGGGLQVAVNGRLAPDLRAADGTAQRTARSGTGEVCRSGPVRWHATLAPGLKPN
ncbi:MAG: hypothetical protein JOZ25_06705 [Actinobacteria bacterium]|nr:hypothetical protein [Actinomycetota bacterium]